MKKTYLKVGILLSMLFTTAVSYANVPSWLIGKWADGNIIVEITSDSKMSIYERDILIKEGSFTFDNNGFIETQWDKDLKPDDEYYFCFSDLSESQWFAHEGGDKLTKLPENTISDDNKSQNKDYSGKLDSHIFVENPQRCWKNISWVYGEWRIPANHPSGKTYAVKITPFYYQATNDIAESGAVDFSGLSKKWYKAMQGQHSLLGDVIYIDDLYFDLTAKRIYQSNLDRKIYLEQTVEYTTTKAKVIFGVIACILGIGILLGLYFLIRKLIRIIIFNAKKFATWIKTKWDNIYPKAISAINKASATTKEQWETNVKPKAKSTIKKVSSNAKEQWEDNVKPMASSAINRISEEIKSKTSDIKEKTEAFSSSESKLVKGALSSKSDSNNDSSFNWKKLIKVFKFAMLIASILGIADAIADESDDSAEIDIDGDGDIDGVAIDTDGDGDIDGVAFDSDGDGDIDGLAVDDNGDGQIDTISIDSNNDGAIDTIAADSNGDGSIDKVAYDTNGDGAFDEIEMDTDGDGVIDTAGIDTDGDGSIDTITESGNTNGYADGYSAEECYHNAQNRIIEIDRQIMNTPDPIQRAALMRERDLIMAQSPSPVDIIHNRMHR